MENFIKNSALTILVVSISTYVFAAGGLPEPPAESPWFVGMIEWIMGRVPELNAWFAATMLFLMALLRGLSEFFTFISKKTETKTDDMIAQYLTTLLKWASAIIGWFGLGSPKK